MARAEFTPRGAPIISRFAANVEIKLDKGGGKGKGEFNLKETGRDGQSSEKLLYFDENCKRSE